MGVRFLKIAVVYLFIGALLGLAMGLSQKFTLAPVHAHLLLLGWATDLATPVDTFGPPPLAAMTKQFLALNDNDIRIRTAESPNASTPGTVGGSSRYEPNSGSS